MVSGEKLLDLVVVSNFGVKIWAGVDLYAANRVEGDTPTHKYIGGYGLNEVKDGHDTYLPRKWNHLCLSYNGYLQTMTGVLVS